MSGSRNHASWPDKRLRVPCCNGISKNAVNKTRHLRELSAHASPATPHWPHIEGPAAAAAQRARPRPPGGAVAAATPSHNMWLQSQAVVVARRERLNAAAPSPRSTARRRHAQT